MLILSAAAASPLSYHPDHTSTSRNSRRDSTQLSIDLHTVDKIDRVFIFTLALASME